MKYWKIYAEDVYDGITHLYIEEIEKDNIGIYGKIVLIESLAKSDATKAKIGEELTFNRWHAFYVRDKKTLDKIKKTIVFQ